MNKLVCTLVLLGVMASGSARAAGFFIDLHSARSVGLANAVTADVGDPSAVFFNPADIIRGEGVLDVLVGDVLIIPHNTFTPVGGSVIRGTTPVIPPFHGYGTYGITRDLSVGVGLTSPFGLRISWPDGWVGQEIVEKVSLATYNANPVVAYRFGRVKLGAGVQVVRATVELKRAINFVGSEGRVDLGAGTWGAGGNAGLLVEVAPKLLWFGANYRSRVKLNFNKGSVHFSDVPPEFAGSGPGQIRDQHASTSVTLPDVVALGLSLQPIEGLRVNFDADYFTWQTFQALDIKFEDPALNIFEPKLWHHTWNFHLGAEYALSKMWKVRAGALWDPTPSPVETLGPDIPDSSRINLAAGLGFHWSGLTADLGYQYIFFRKHQSTLPALPGTYNGHVHIAGLSVGYRLGGE